MDDIDFGLQPHVDYLYQHGPRRLEFRAETVDEFRLWRVALRQEVSRLLGIAGRTLPAALPAERVQAIDRGAYVEEKLALDLGEDVFIPLYVLVPKTPPPYKPILVLHGHNPSVQFVLGNYPDEATAALWRAVDNNYAQVLAEAGYLVCAVAQRGFGERRTGQIIVGDVSHSCRHLSFEYLLQGRTLLGERVWDAQCAASYLLARPDVVPGILGCTGNSGGAATALWMAALDERITVLVPSCYFCSFKASILGVQHCECNYVPGILTLAEMGDLAALVAPRPMRFIAGQNDPIFPVAATRAQFETVRRAYALLDASDRCSLTEHPGEHAYNHALSHAWFAQWL